MNEAERLQRAMKNKVTSSIEINQVRETTMEDLVTEPALADSTGILEAPIPVCLLKVSTICGTCLHLAKRQPHIILMLLNLQKLPKFRGSYLGRILLAGVQSKPSALPLI
jgi:hypothetical protein